MAEHAGRRPARAAARGLSPQQALAALQAALRAHDDAAAEAAALALAAHPRAAWPALQPWLNHADPDRRWWAVRTLAALPQAGDDIRRALAQRLHDPDPAVRQAAALALRHHPTPEALPALLDLLAQADPLTAGLAADALAALGADAVPALLETLRAGPPQARREAARALAAIQDTRAIPALFAALDDPSPHVTAWAEEALQRMGVGMVFWTSP